MGAFIWIAIAFVSIVPSLLIGAVGVRGGGGPLTFSTIFTYVKKRPLLIGLCFVTFAALMYALFFFSPS